MSCNAVATIRANLKLLESLDQALKELTLDQAKALFQALILEGTKFTAGNILTNGYPGGGGAWINTIECGTLRVYIQSINGKPTGATLTDLYQDFTQEEFTAKLTRFTQQTIKAAGLIKQAKAIALIQKQYGASLQTAPNGAKILTLDI